MALKNETAARSFRLRDGGEMEKLGSVFHQQKYTTATVTTMPSCERVGLMAHVVAKGGRLFLVGYHAGGAL